MTFPACASDLETVSAPRRAFGHVRDSNVRLSCTPRQNMFDQDSHISMAYVCVFNVQNGDSSPVVGWKCTKGLDRFQLI